MVTWVQTLRRRIRFMQDRRFLRRHGCVSWKQYHRHYDPRVNYSATQVRDFYHGYPVFHCFEDYQHVAYDWDVHQSGFDRLQEWADANCQGRVRFDILRAINEPSTNNEWVMNELGGWDYIFAAFENPRDYTLFALRWL